MKKAAENSGEYIIRIMLQSLCQQKSLPIRYTTVKRQNGAKIQAFSILGLKGLSFAVFR